VENIPANQVENWAKIQSDRFAHNVIRGFHTELETVYEEKNMSLTNDQSKVSEVVNSVLYPHHPYGTQTVLGTQEHLKNPSITNIKKYYETYYVPNNMAVCLAGDFDPDQMIRTIDKYFGKFKPNKNLPKVEIVPEHPITQPIVKEVRGLDAQSVTVAWRAGGASNPDADLLEITGSILSNGRAGLFDVNINQKQKVLSANLRAGTMADYGSVSMSGRPKAGQTLDEVKDILMGEIARLKAGDFDQELIEAAVNNYKSRIMSTMDGNSGRANLFVSTFTNGLEWKDVVEKTDRLSQITKEQIVAFANRILGDNNYVVVYKRQGPDPNELKIAKPEITAIETNRDAASPYLKNIQQAAVTPIEPVFVDYDRDLSKLTAKSGIPVLYVKNPTTGLFQLDYVFETGANNDPAVTIAFDYLKYLGTNTLTLEEINTEFYRLACTYNVSVSDVRTSLTLSGLSENMGRAMELLESLLSDAKADPKVLENMKADIIKRRNDAKLSQSSNFAMLQEYAMYGEKSPAKNILSAAQLARLTPQELLSKIKNLVQIQHRIFYYGPLTQSEAIAAINQYHHVPASLTPPPVQKLFPYKETRENRVYLAQYDSKQIQFIQYSNRGEAYNQANDPDVQLYNQYFGGGMNGIVFQEMREARGLAYTARASLSQPGISCNPYYFTAFIATQNDKMGLAMDAFEEIINMMPESEHAFALAKEYVLTRIRTQRIIKNSLIRDYISAQDLGLNVDRRKNIFEKVQNMTLADVKAFQQQWIKNRPYFYAILGDASDLDLKKLESFGPITRLTQEQLFGY
ncbi:MAG: insulinase family protein, partial [Bacteroidetes bacterium]|nr:insulinase family protein [Bacteroidota bacterium]